MVRMRTSIRRAALSLEPKLVSDPMTFVEDDNVPVWLIEVLSDGTARRLQVTESLLEIYIEHDYQTKPTNNKQALYPGHETIKLLCAHLHWSEWSSANRASVVRSEQGHIMEVSLQFPYPCKHTLALHPLHAFQNRIPVY